ncbi:MAG TPA: DUF5677 domain-containing protein [Opitutaceae bacterium]|nr:DUF5677 domain-containing protein [Opitutaceae bacterium]
MNPDNPNPFIYDTEFAEDAVRKNYEPHVHLLHELCSYGSNLLLRCFLERDKKLEDAILIACLFRQFLCHLDAVSVLIAKGCGDASLLHLRAMLEEEIYLNWLVKEHTAMRAKHLYVWNLRKRRRANRMVDPNSEEAKEIKASIGPNFERVVIGLQTPEMQTEAKTQNSNIDAILADPDLAKIDRAFEASRKGKNYDVDWYKPCGIPSLAKMAKEVKMMAHYRFFYSKWSEVMHSSGFFDHLHVDDLGASVEQVRDVEEIANAISVASSTANGVFRIFIHRYRPGEIDSFNRKYLTEWRDRSMNIPKVKINRISAER